MGPNNLQIQRLCKLVDGCRIHQLGFHNESPKLPKLIFPDHAMTWDHELSSNRAGVLGMTPFTRFGSCIFRLSCGQAVIQTERNHLINITSARNSTFHFSLDYHYKGQDQPIRSPWRQVLNKVSTDWMWEYQGIFCGILSVPQNIVMDLNNVMNLMDLRFKENKKYPIIQLMMPHIS